MDIKTATLVNEANAEHDLRAQHKGLSNTEPPNQKDLITQSQAALESKATLCCLHQGGPQEKCTETGVLAHTDPFPKRSRRPQGNSKGYLSSQEVGAEKGRPRRDLSCLPGLSLLLSCTAALNIESSPHGRARAVETLQITAGSLISSPCSPGEIKASREHFVHVNACIQICRSPFLYWSCFSDVFQIATHCQVPYKVFFLNGLGRLNGSALKELTAWFISKCYIVQYRLFMLQKFSKNRTGPRRFYGKVSLELELEQI